MSLTKRIPEVLGLISALVLAGGCNSLNVSNLNAPDSPRLLSDPATVQSIAIGAMRTWFSTTQGPTDGADPYPGLTLSVMAKSHVAAWNNYNIRFYTGCTNTPFTGYPNGSCGGATEGAPYPRIEWQNDPASAQRTQIEYSWYGYYSALSSANDVVKAIRTNPAFIITDAKTTKMVETMGVLVQALSLSQLALMYDQGFIVDYNTDLTTLKFSTRAQMRDAALAKFDDVINNLTKTAFTVPGDFFGKPGVSYTNVSIAQLANTMAARTLAYYPRKGTENADISAGGQVNWAKVLSYAQNGISSGTTFDWVFHQDGCINWCDYFKVWTNDFGTMRLHTRVAHMLDPVSQEDPWPVLNPNTALKAPVTANVAPQAATPVAMTYITTPRQLTVGGGVDLEKVVVTATTATTFSGIFTKSHPSTPLTAAVAKNTATDTTSRVVTPASMTSINVGSVLYIDAPPNQENVKVSAITATTFTTHFGKDHAAVALVAAPVHRNGGAPGNDNPNSPDKRLGDGTMRTDRAGAAYAAAALVNPDTSTPPKGGTDYAWSYAEEIQRKTRGSWHQSSILQVRYDSLSLCGDNPQGVTNGVGDAPVVLAAENDLIWAEALLRQPVPNPGAAATLINHTHVGPDLMGRARGGLTPSTGTLADLQYEQDVELAGTSTAVFFNQRRIDNLEPLTPHEMPVPAKELGVLQKPLYTWGGANNPPNSNPTAPAPGAAVALVQNAPQMWVELQRRAQAQAQVNAILARRQ